MSREIKLTNKPVRSGQPAKILQRKFLWVFLVWLSVFLMAFLWIPNMEDVIVLNHEQKQCATMFPGDSYISYEPPGPWQKAEPDSNGMIHTQFGSCNLNEVNIYSTKNVEDCCKKLGYTFIGKIEGTKKDNSWLSIFDVLFAIIFLACYPTVPAAIFTLALYLLWKWLKSNSNKQKNIGA